MALANQEIQNNKRDKLNLNRHNNGFNLNIQKEGIYSRSKAKNFKDPHYSIF
jgi:hypothetical protein